MRAITIGVLVAVVMVGCTTVVIPRTPEAIACSRECMGLRSMCIGSCGGACGSGQYAGYCVAGCASGCNRQQTQCLLTCPGAYEK